MSKLRVGIIGATGMVGQRFVSLLQGHPWFKVEVLAASKKSEGKTYGEAVSGRWYMKSVVPVDLADKKILDVCDFKKISSMVDFVFCAVNMPDDDLRSLEYSYAKCECPVVSNNSAHRWTDDVPIIIPEINADHVGVVKSQRKRIGTKRGFIVAKPNCSLQCFLPLIAPLCGVEFVAVSTYQAISGAGKVFSSFPEIDDNIIPYIKGEECKTENEPLKVLGHIENGKIISSSSPRIVSNCIRVPISDGHTSSVFVRFKNKVSCDEIIDKWKNFNPLSLPSSPRQFINYFEQDDRPQVKMDRNIENGMGISVGHLSKFSENELKFVSVSHNTIRGAAGGAILCAELLHSRGYF